MATTRRRVARYTAAQFVLLSVTVFAQYAAAQPGQQPGAPPEAPKTGQAAGPQGQKVSEKQGRQEAEPAAPAGTPSIVGKIAPIFIDPTKNTGQTWAYVRNDTQKGMTVTLIADSVTTRPGGEEVNARLSFASGSQGSDSPFLEMPLKAGAMLPVKILVVNYFHPGESSARIRIGDNPHDIHVSFYDVPFKVALQSPTPDKPKLALVRETPGLLIVKNDDPMRYPVAWRLSLRDHGEVLHGRVMVPASSQIEVRLNPPEGWFRQWFTGLFKNEQRPGYLTLQFAPESVSPGGQGNQSTAPDTRPLPSRTVPVELDLAYWDAGKLGGVVIIVLTLAAGAVLSMVLNLWIPNHLRRANLLGTLSGLADDTRRISKKTDSRLRVGLRVERLRLSNLLRGLWVPSLAANDQLKRHEAEAAALRRRVDMVTLLDAANERLGDLRSATSDAPPAILDSIDVSLQEATGLLSKRAPTDDEFTAAKVSIAEATKRLDQIGREDAELAKVLAARVTRLAPLFADTGVTGSTARCKNVKGALASIFKVLDNAQYKGATGIPAADYHTVDLNTQKLDLLREFIEAANSIDAATADPEGRMIIGEIEPTLVEELRKGDWRALTRARCLVRQVKERVTSRTIEAALQDDSASIEYDPRAVYANEAIRLRVRLANADWDDSAARHDFTCEWDFGTQVGKETGWDIAHYFRVQEEASFTVSFIRPDGKAVVGKDGKMLKVKESITFAKGSEVVSDRAKAEGWRLALAMSFAIVALIVGAHEQFMKLDVLFGLVTVLVLGFTTNTIKDLFTKSTP